MKCILRPRNSKNGKENNVGGGGGSSTSAFIHLYLDFCIRFFVSFARILPPLSLFLPRYSYLFGADVRSEDNTCSEEIELNLSDRAILFACCATLRSFRFTRENAQFLFDRLPSSRQPNVKNCTYEWHLLGALIIRLLFTILCIYDITPRKRTVMSPWDFHSISCATIDFYIIYIILLFNRRICIASAFIFFIQQFMHLECLLYQFALSINFDSVASFKIFRHLNLYAFSFKWTYSVEITLNLTTDICQYIQCSSSQTIF